MVSTAGPIPLWLLWIRALCFVVSIVGLAIHYNLAAHDRLTVKHSIVRFFVAIARENPLKRLNRAAAAVESGMRRIYGYRARRVVAISCSLSILYFIVVFALCGGDSVGWRSIQEQQATLERAADPYLYDLPAETRTHALKKKCYPLLNTEICNAADLSKYA